MKFVILALCVTGCSVTPKTVDTSDADRISAFESLLSSAGETIVSKQDETLSILHENTTALAAIKDQIEAQSTSQTEPVKEVIDSESTSPVVVPAETPQSETPGVVQSSDDDYVVQFTAPWCGVCHQWTNRELRKLKQAGIRVRQINIDEPENVEWKRQVSTLPTFWLVDGKTQTRRSLRVGYTSGETLIQQIRPAAKLSSACGCSAACTCGCQSGGECQCGQALPRLQASQTDLIQLHNRLHGGGSWSWPGNLRQHLITVHRVSVN